MRNLKETFAAVFRTAAADIEQTRADIEKTKAEIETVRAAPLTLKEAVSRLHTWAESLPDDNPVGEFFNAAERAPRPGASYGAPNLRPDHATALLVGRGPVVAHLTRRLEAEAAGYRAAGVTPLSAADREAKISALTAKLADLERQEEDAVRQMEEAGYGVQRRPDVDIRVLLDVK